MTFDDSAPARPVPATARPSRRLPFWLLVPVGSTLMGLFVASGGVPPMRALIHWWAWGLLAWPIVWVDRRLPIPQDALGLRAAWHVPLSVAWTLVYLVITEAADTLAGGSSLDGLFSTTLPTALRGGAVQWSVIYYWLILGGYLAIDYHRQSRERERRATELEGLLVQAQLSALRAQLNPHFLFNALNTISAEVERQPKVARRMLEHLGELLRLSLESARPDRVTLTDELHMLEQYLAIQRARFAGRLEVRLEIDPAAADALVPGLLLQPLVENAIRHGVAPRAKVGRLRIAARAEQDRLHLTVEDDGVGLPDGWTLSAHAGIGLANTSRRLTAQYGPRHAFAVRPLAAGGVAVDVLLPLDRAPAGGGVRETPREAASEVSPVGDGTIAGRQDGAGIAHANADR